MADPRKKPNDKDNKAKNKKPPEPDLELPSDDDSLDDEILEILDAVEEDVPVVEASADEDLDEIVEVVEAVDEDDEIRQKPSLPKKSDGNKKTPVTDDDVDFEAIEALESGSDIAAIEPAEVVDEEEPVVVELASDVDLASLTDDKEGRPSASDIITEALESGVDLSATEKKSAKAERSSSDSDIDLDSILSEADDSSAVNLDGSGPKRALSASDSVETKRHSDEAIEVGDDLLVDSPGAKKDDAILVTPKRKVASAEDVDLDAELAAKPRSRSDSESGMADDAIAIDPDEAVSVESEDSVFEEPKPALGRGKKGREPELVGAGAGSRRRGGFMPFLLGLFTAVLLVGGAAAAAWYFDMLPKSPSAQQAPPPPKKQPSQPGIAKSVEEFNALQAQKDRTDAQLAELKQALDNAKIPADPKLLQDHLNTLVAAKKEGPAGKDFAAITAERDAANKQLAQLKDLQAAADKEFKDLQETASKNQALLKDAKVLQGKYESAQKAIESLKAENNDLTKLAAGDNAGLIKQLDTAKAELLVAKKVLDGALAQQKALDDAHQAAKQALEMAQKDLGEATKVREALQSAYDTAKAELDRARAGSPAPAVTELSIAESLIKQPDPKAQGQGYIILGASQTRTGNASEGLSNIIKGLKLVDPQIALLDPAPPAPKQPSTYVAKAPIAAPPDVIPTSNPLAAEKLYTKGLELFWARSYVAAETQFTKAIGSFHDDARYHYYRGLSRYLQGTTQKRKQAHADFLQGVQLEKTHHPGITEVNASLERIQGELRTMLNGYRERQQ